MKNLPYSHTVERLAQIGVQMTAKVITVIVVVPLILAFVLTGSLFRFGHRARGDRKFEPAKYGISKVPNLNEGKAT